LAASNPDTLTDLERAGRFLYLQRLTFGGKVAGRSFGVDNNAPSRFDVTKLGPLLDEIHERLAGVVIECLPWAEFVERYDSPTTLFYLDPPYWGSETDYGAGVFTRADFIRLAARLSEIAGKFLLSVNDVPEMREAFSRFRNRKRGDTLHRFRRQRDRGRGDRGERAIAGCGAAGARSVIAVIASTARLDG
jgi:DNA adenine methylase